MTATLFAGSGASLTALPASAVSGTHTAFRSTGIDDNADALAITIDSSENVIIGASSFDQGSFSGAATGINVHGPSPLVLLKETDTNIRGYIGIAGSDFYVVTPDAADLFFGTNDTTRMRIDSAGNVGIGASISESGQGSNSQALFVGSYSSLINSGAYESCNLAENAYIGTASSDTWKYRETSEAARHEMRAGVHRFKVASSGSADADITWTDAMTIDNSGHITLAGNSKWLASQIYDLGTMAASATVTASPGVGCNGAYEIAVWNTDGNAYGHGLYTFCCGGYNANFTIQTAYESHYGATDVPTVSFVRVSGCNWQLRVVNNDADSKHFYASIRCVHSQ
jgi:hypothetical protein